MVGEKQNKTNKQGRKPTKEAGVKVVCKGHRRQEGIQEVKPRSKRQTKTG